MKLTSIMTMKVLLTFLCLLAYAAGAQVQPLSVLQDFPNVRDFTRHQQEGYATAQSVDGGVSVIVALEASNGQWQAQQIATFSGKYQDLEPAFSPDGLRLYFASNRPLQEGGDAKDYDIWYVERDSLGGPWSAPRNVGAPVNTGGNEFYPSVTAAGHLYFTSDANASTKDDIYMALWQDSAYLPPSALSDAINTSGYEFNSYVAPSGLYLLFSGYNRPGGKGSGDLYISWQHPLEGWLPAQPLRDINSDKMDYCPWVYQDTLYFTSKRSDIGSFSNVEALKTALNQHENGQSRLYQAPLPMLDLPFFSLMQRRDAGSIQYYTGISNGDTIQYNAFTKEAYGKEPHRWLMYRFDAPHTRGSIHIISKKSAQAGKILFEDSIDNMRLLDLYILQRSLFEVRFQEVRLTYANGKKLTFYIKFIE